jgi:hypothetical protein
MIYFLQKLKSMKKKLENQRVQKKKVVEENVPFASPEVSERVQVLNRRLERMKNKKEGFYAPKVSTLCTIYFMYNIHFTYYIYSTYRKSLEARENLMQKRCFCSPLSATFFNQMF